MSVSDGNRADTTSEAERVLGQLDKPTFTPPDDLDIIDDAASVIRSLLAERDSLRNQRDQALKRVGELERVVELSAQVLDDGSLRAAEARVEALQQAVDDALVVFVDTLWAEKYAALAVSERQPEKQPDA